MAVHSKWRRSFGIAAVVLLGRSAHSGAALISLTGDAPVGYGQQVGAITMTGPKNGSYNVSTVTFPATSVGYVAVTGFSPASDTEIYGFQIFENGVFPNLNDFVSLFTDINDSGGNVDTDGTLRAGFSFDILGHGLMEVYTYGTTSSTPYLGFNFSGLSETWTVSSIAAVPEPISLAALSIASGCLLRRAKR